jgi:hypothetical protein
VKTLIACDCRIPFQRLPMTNFTAASENPLRGLS